MKEGSLFKIMKAKKNEKDVHFKSFTSQLSADIPIK